MNPHPRGRITNPCTFLHPRQEWLEYYQKLAAVGLRGSPARCTTAATQLLSQPVFVHALTQFLLSIKFLEVVLVDCLATETDATRNRNVVHTCLKRIDDCRPL